MKHTGKPQVVIQSIEVFPKRIGLAFFVPYTQHVHNLLFVRKYKKNKQNINKKQKKKKKKRLN